MIYLDNCATTKPRKEVVDKMVEAMTIDFGNPSSLHRLGFHAEKKVKEAREIIADYLKVENKEIYFTSGGTESNNIAIQSIARKYSKKGKHIITSAIEHPSVLDVYKHLEDVGFSVTLLDVDKNGYVDLDTLSKEIKEDTILVSIIHVNNEIGALQNIKGIKEIINKSVSKPLLHLDGIQSFGKVEFSLKALGVDTYSFSGHKVYGPKGIGGLYICKDLKLDPILYGGGQESGLRSGTENVPGIIGLGEAVKILSTNSRNEAQEAFKLKKYLVSKIIKEIENVKVNTSLDATSSPYILSLTFKGTRGEILLHYLEEKGIYVSTSSACSSNGTTKSHVLKSIGLSNDEIEGTIRICLSYEITKEDIDYTVEQLRIAVNDIRSIIGRWFIG